MIQYKTPHLTIFQSALYQTTSTVLETADLVLVVDPCWLPEEVYTIQTHVNRIRGDRPLYLLFTHGDFDHIIGYKAFPDAITIGSRELQEHPDKEKKLNFIREFDDRNYITRNYSIEFPMVDIVVEVDGQQFIVGDTTLTFYKAPGHTADGVFTIVEGLGVWIAGDYLSNVEFPFIYHDSYAYEETMHKAEQILANHQIHLLIPGHGQATTEVAEIQKRTQDSLDYIQALRQAVQGNDEVKMGVLIADSPFPLGQKQYHQDNVKLMKQELERSK